MHVFEILTLILTITIHIVLTDVKSINIGKVNIRQVNDLKSYIFDVH